MMRIRSIILSALMLFSTFVPESAQENDPLVMATVHRPPFAFADTPELRGFSVDLMRAIGEDIRRKIVFEPQDFFSQMLTKVKTGDVDWAIANISITTERERKMDFTQPIFVSGIKIMIPNEGSGASIFSLFTWDIALVVLRGLALLFFGGLLMWLFERRVQPYFDKPAREALFPSFW